MWGMTSSKLLALNDLHKLEPTDKFDGFAAGETVTLPLIGEYWTLFETDFMPRAFVTAPDAEPKVIAALNTEDVASFVSGLEGENLKRTPVTTMYSLKRCLALKRTVMLRCKM